VRATLVNTLFDVPDMPALADVQLNQIPDTQPTRKHRPCRSFVYRALIVDASLGGLKPSTGENRVEALLVPFFKVAHHRRVLQPRGSTDV
jgi:hypothetical protein